MEEKIRSRYTPEILADISARFGVLPDQLETLDGFESYIYRFSRQGRRYILRISHSSRRSEAWIRGEVDWINYLVKGGASASQVILSRRGSLVERVEDGHGEAFLGTVFEHAPGQPPWEYGWSDALYQTLGKTIGRMHALSRVYLPKDSQAFRPQWDDPMMLNDPAWLPKGDEAINQKYDQVLAFCRRLPVDRDNYGMIHFDAHSMNYFVDDGGEIHLFDFDDCCYNWYANDIAMVLFYKVIGQKDLGPYTFNFMKHFIEGYRRENAFRAKWLGWIPTFMKMREIELYGVIHRSLDVENLEGAWERNYMDGRREKIMGDVPYLDFDFSMLAPLLA